MGFNMLEEVSGEEASKKTGVRVEDGNGSEAERGRVGA